MKKRTTLLASLALAGTIGAVSLGVPLALAQENDKSWLQNFLESKLSAPGRQISIGAISGTLSSNPSIASLTVSDDAGPWLTLQDVSVSWNRSALLRGRLDIDSLNAASLNVARKPNPGPETAPSSDSGGGGFSLPIDVKIDEIAIPQIHLGAPVIGQEADLSLKGAAAVTSDETSASLQVERQDDPGGSFNARFSLVPGQNVLDIEASFDEPAGGLVSTAAGIPGAPPLAFAIDGEGPLNDFTAQIALSAKGEEKIKGQAAVQRQDEAYHITANLSGSLSGIATGDSAQLLSGESQLAVDVLRSDDGRISIRRVDLQSQRVNLSATAELAADGFPSQGEVDLSVNEGQSAPLALPGYNGEASIGGLTLTASLSGDDEKSWQAEIAARNVTHPQGNLASLNLRGSGQAQSLGDPQGRQATFDVQGQAEGIEPRDRALAQAVGQAISLNAKGSWQAGSPVRVEESRVVAGNTEASFTGAASLRSILGRAALSTADLSRFSGLAGQDLAGAVDVDANGSVDLKSMGFDLTVGANGRGLGVGIAPLDALLIGPVRLEGGVARNETGGFAFRDLHLNSDALALTADGSYAADTVDLALRAEIDDLARATDRAKGAARLVVDVSGTQAAPQISATATGDNLVMMDKRLTGAKASFNGTVAGSKVDGEFSLAGNLGGVPIDGSGRIASLEGGVRQLQDLLVTAGAAKLAGDAAMRADGLVSGDLSLDAPNIAAIAPLFLMEAEGAVDLDIALSSDEGQQDARVSGTIDNLKLEQASVTSGRIDLSGENLLQAPALQGMFDFRGIRAGGFDVRSLEGTAEQTEGNTDFRVTADTADGGGRLAGQLQPIDKGFSVNLETLSFSHQGVAAELQRPSRIVLENGTVGIDDLALAAGGGQLTVNGSAGNELDLQVVLDAVNAAVVNAFAPDLDLAGTISGQAKVKGTSARPEPAFDVTWRGATAAPVRQANAGPFDISAKGNYVDGSVDIDAAINGRRGERLEVKGTVPVSGAGRMDVNARIVSLPAAAINAIRPDLGAEGNITGTASARGTLQAPAARFDLTWQNASLQQTRSIGLGALTLSATGAYDNGAVRLQNSRITGSGVELAINGSVAVTGSQSLDLRVNGTAPLELVNTFLASRDAALSGRAQIDVGVRGALTSPQISGSATTSGATFADPETGTVLRNIQLRANFTGDRVVVESLNAQYAPSGTLSGSGSVGLSGGYPLDLTLAVRNGRYSDGDLATARFDADLSIRGAALSGPTIGGEVRLQRVDITVPESLPGGALALDVEHLHATAAILRTVHQAMPRSRPADGADTGGGVNLDLLINAPNRIFVRGRGLDAELGGRVTLRGSTSNIVATGGFELIRGRLDILTKRITIDSGEVNFIGDLDPYLDFSATTDSGDITVTILISGRASDPAVTFSSVPQLPQDEVLAQLLFGHSLADLSPFQIARLAAAAAELGGLTEGPGLFGRLREATGLDDLDIVTDSEGNTAVQAGRYISDNIYLGVQSGAGADSTKVTINLDVTKGVKVRGELGAEGDSALGIALEHEY
ncbi:translocation/assembly module TamB domain-containing protein [Afifella sp. JA880]|uniref:translocation/assembly module TamB domain-containing protein n=1 Tax=Afifella sp. JA880 TaxID=2975280 RepID=UPI0021BAA08A|nr:translocation/assembly module TamB domain-containing protein [Afifella sp. JA880]MCT8268636.1 translocation/assembly module TamB domain-containing protein [Afifella sp. JA880]